jgi:hypothetical protein
VCKGRKLALLRERWIMLGPQAEPGNCIAILHGSSVPWVLRKEEEGSHAVVGQCYVDGIMHGEAVTWQEDDADIFVLCLRQREWGLLDSYLITHCPLINA